MSSSFTAVATAGLREVLSLALQLSLPFLGALFAVGLVMGVAQSATGVRDRTLARVPRLLAALLLLSVMGSWLGGRVTALVGASLSSVPGAGRTAHGR